MIKTRNWKLRVLVAQRQKQRCVSGMPEKVRYCMIALQIEREMEGWLLLLTSDQSQSSDVLENVAFMEGGGGREREREGEGGRGREGEGGRGREKEGGGGRGREREGEKEKKVAGEEVEKEKSYFVNINNAMCVTITVAEWMPHNNTDCVRACVCVFTSLFW